MGEAGFQALVQVLQDFVGDEPIGGAAASALAGDARALDVLLYALTSPVFEVGQAATMSLTQLGEQVWEPMLEMLKNDQSRHGHFFASHVYYQAGSVAVPVLQGVLRESEQAHMRVLAANTLGWIGDERALEPLRQSLHDEDADVRLEAALGLAYAQDGSGVGRLIEALPIAHPFRGPSIIDALAELGEPAFQPLVRVLSDQSAAATTRANAVVALGKMKHALAVEPLVTALRDDDAGVRRHAAKALGGLRDPDAVDALNQALNDESREVRSAALLALAKYEDPAVIPQLVSAIHEAGERLPGDGPSFAPYVYVLSQFREQAVGPFRELLQAENQRVCTAALQGLQFLGELGKPVLVAATRDPRPETPGEKSSSCSPWSSSGSQVPKEVSCRNP
jgi:HEAT repeat protein